MIAVIVKIKGYEINVSFFFVYLLVFPLALSIIQLLNVYKRNPMSLVE